MIEIVIRLDRTKLSTALQLNNFHANGNFNLSSL